MCIYIIYTRTQACMYACVHTTHTHPMREKRCNEHTEAIEQILLEKPISSSIFQPGEEWHEEKWHKTFCSSSVP